MADSTPKSYQTDPNLYLYTSLTSGSSHIITATARLETILKANKIPFLALDVATDERARMLWGRRAGKRKLPGLVQMGLVVGDLEEVEEWNEYGELKEKLGPAPGAPSTPTPSAFNTPSKPPAVTSTPTTTPSKVSMSTETPSRLLPSSTTDSPFTTAMRQAGFEAAKRAGDAKKASNGKMLGQGKGLEQSGVSSEALRKLDNSAPSGMPPPSGTTNPGSAIAPETGTSTAACKADAVPSTNAGSPQVTDGMEKINSGESNATGSQPARSTGELPSAENIKDIEKKTAISEKPEAEDKEAEKIERKDSEPEIPKPVVKEEETEEVKPEIDSEGHPEKTRDMTAVSNELSSLPGKKTQDQPAASGAEAGHSVAD